MHLGRSVLTLVHTVLFEFSADANPKDVRAAVDRFVALKEQCVLPTTCEPYVLSLKAGKNNSPEGLEVRDTGQITLLITNAILTLYYHRTVLLMALF